MLFKKNVFNDAAQTQLAYRVKYWPYAKMTGAARAMLHTNRKVYLHKDTILKRCNADLTKLEGHGHMYPIVWAYNNMPTEREWDKKHDKTLIACEFRSSPLLDGVYVAVLSFELPSEFRAELKQASFFGD